MAACGTRSTRLPAAHSAGLWSRRRLGHVAVTGTFPLGCGRCGDSAIYVEYLGAATCDSAGVEAYVQGCVNVMGELVMVEDNSEGAGHMQIQNQSPITGFFEPAVGLGDSVRVGDVLGRVTDMMGDRVEVNALATGRNRPCATHISFGQGRGKHRCCFGRVGRHSCDHPSSGLQSTL